MIIKENKTYLLRTPEGDRTIAWEMPDDSVEVTKTWELSQIYQFRLKHLGCIALNKDLLLFLKKEGKQFITINYRKNLMLGKIKGNINIWLQQGDNEHNEDKPYDNQIILPAKFIREWGDNTVKEILKEIWKDKTPELEQRKNLTQTNPQKRLL